MKRAKIVLTQQKFEELRRGLRWDGKERSVYLLCNSSSCGGSLKLIPHKICVPEEQDYVWRSPTYYVLKKSFINRVLNEAVENESDLVQAHIHPGDPAVFSAIDEIKEHEFMHHIADKIDGIYHGSLVFGKSLDTLDGWAYDRVTTKVVPIDKVIVVGKTGLQVFVPPRSSLTKRIRSPYLERTFEAFGESAVKMLGLLDFGVVGASALGGPICEFLARDNVRSVIICDPDSIDGSNLNRLPGTTPADIGKPKAEFYRNYIRQVNKAIRVSGFQNSFYDNETQGAFRQADIIFGCVDSGARLSINRLALANLIPYFDLGASIDVKHRGSDFIGGQVHSVIPGRKVCLNCSGVFDGLMYEFLSRDAREREQRQGYIKSEESIVNPLVHFLDYTIAGIGYLAMLKYVWATRVDEEIFRVHYNGAVNKLTQSTCSEVGCINCGLGANLGRGDKVSAMVPSKAKEFDNRFLEKGVLVEGTSCSDNAPKHPFFGRNGLET